MAYYNYHSQVKKAIVENKVIALKIVEKYNNISPCLIIYFDNHKPYPIRKEKFQIYFDYISSLGYDIDNLLNKDI